MPDAEATNRSGRAVVVVVPGERERHGPAAGAGEPGGLRDIGEAAPRISIQAHSTLAGDDDVEIAVAVDVGQEHAPALARGGLRGADELGGGIRERHRGSRRVDQIRFRPRGRERFGVLSLLEIRLRVGARVWGAAKRLETLHGGRTARVSRARQSHGESVGRGRVVGLSRDRVAQQRNCLGVLALLGVDLAEIYLRADIRRVELERLLKGANRVGRAVLRRGQSGRAGNGRAVIRAGWRPLRPLCAPGRACRRRTGQSRDSACASPRSGARRNASWNDDTAASKSYCSRRATPMLLAR